MKENIETKDVQRTEYLDKNGLDMLWAKVKENTHNQVEVERNRAVAKENSITNSLGEFVSKTATDTQIIKSELNVKNKLRVAYNNANVSYTDISNDRITINGNGDTTITANNTEGIKVSDYSNPGDRYSAMNKDYISVRDSRAELRIGSNDITSYKLSKSDPTGLGDANFQLRSNGVHLYGGDNNHVLTSGGSTIDITQYALKSVYDEKIAALEARIAALEAKHVETA